DHGTAVLRGVDVVADPIGVQRRIGYLPENAPLYHEMTVQDYLLMMAELREIPADKQRSMLSDAIYATGLEEYLTRQIGKLSRGYRQRVGIAQAILHRPELLILDEPTCERVLVIMRGKLRADARVAELRTANAAVVAIDQSASGVAEALKAVSGVDTVEKVGEPEDGFQ